MEVNQVQQSNIDNILNQKDEADNSENINISSTGTSGFNFDRSETSSTTNTNATNKAEQKKKVQSKWDDEEEDDDDEEIQKILEEKSKNAKSLIQSLTISEEDNIYRKFTNSSIPGVQVALGNFKMAFSYLKSQLGICGNYESLKPIMKEVYLSSYSHIQFIPSVPVNEFLLRSGGSSGTSTEPPSPLNGIDIKVLQNKLENGFDLITENNMPDAMKVFRDVIKMAIFSIVRNKSDENAIKEIIYICSEYIYLTRLSMKGDEVKSDKVKYAEVCCAMSTCNLTQSIHKFLIYKKTKVACKGIKNFITALVFIKKMLMYEKELGSEYQNNFDQAKAEFDNYQKIGTNQHTLSFNVNENLPNARQFYCASSLTRIDLSMKSLKCVLCQSISNVEFKGQVCGTCSLSTLGEEVLGFKLMDSYE